MYTHHLTLYRNELPPDLVAEFDKDFEAKHGNNIPRDERYLKVTVQSSNPDPEQVAAMLVEQLFGEAS